jgi:hypothetical protein
MGWGGAGSSLAQRQVVHAAAVADAASMASAASIVPAYHIICVTLIG